MDFKKLANSAVSVTVDGEKVDLRAPSITAKIKISELSAGVQGAETQEILKKWLEVSAYALEATVVTEQKLTSEEWSRVLSIADSGQGPDGLQDLVQAALRLCGLNTGQESTDAIDEVVDSNVGKQPSE